MTSHDHDERHEDELRARLAAADPARPGGPADVVDEPPDVVSTRIEEAVMATRTTTPNPTESGSDEGGGSPRGSRSRWLAAAAALVLLAAAAGAAALGGFLDNRDRATGPDRTLSLSLPGSDVSMSCAQFDVAFLRDMPLAFAGTASSVTEDQVVLEVDQWFKAGRAQREASEVTLSVPGQNTSAALDGVEFREGERYLVTATDGQVNGCGFSGPATPELTAAYQEAFTG